MKVIMKYKERARRMACGDAQHRHTCNSLSNCYWSGNDGNFYSGIIPEGWTGENVDATVMVV